MLILNIFLSKNGFSDDVIAEFTSYRYLGVLVFAFPIGLIIKGRPLKPLFISAALIIPISSISVLFAIQYQFHLIIRLSFLFWGIGLMLYQVGALPFIMRIRDKRSETESISLNFANWSAALLTSGLIISLSGSIHLLPFIPDGFRITEFHLLLFVSVISVLGLVLVRKLHEPEPLVLPRPIFQVFSHLSGEYDWAIILKVAVPTFLIAVGAGLTIPFMNLYFYNIFHVDFQQFSMIGSTAAILVFISALIIPYIRRRYGYYIAILFTQALGIFFLIILASTELMAEKYPWVLFIAIICYIFRQPLMNMAGPVSSELTMNYVGDKNQELISAIQSSIWSASWFISAKIFQYLRGQNLHYYQIFLITASLYSLGTGWYGFIIKDYYKLVSISKK